MNPYFAMGLGLSLIAMFVGLTRSPLKGIGGLYLTGASLLVGGFSAVDLQGRGYGVGASTLAGGKIFAAMFVAFAFWYGLGLVLNLVWRKLTD